MNSLCSNRDLSREISRGCSWQKSVAPGRKFDPLRREERGERKEERREKREEESKKEERSKKEVRREEREKRRKK